MNYLEAEDLIRMNTYVITTHSPKEEIRVRDVGALQMIVETPKQQAYGTDLYNGIHEKAAILFINLITKHCFHNGNKRTAWVAMVVFYDINGYSTSFSTQEGIDLCLDIVNAKANGEHFDDLKNRIITFFKNTGCIQKK